MLRPHQEHVLQASQDARGLAVWVPGIGTSLDLSDHVVRVARGPVLVIGPECWRVRAADSADSGAARVKVTGGMLLVGSDMQATQDPAVTIRSSDAVALEGLVTNGSVVIEGCTGVLLRDCTIMGGVRVDDAVSVQVEGGGAPVHLLEQ